MATSLIVRHFPMIDTVTFSSHQTNYVFVLPLLHHLHRSSRLFVGPLDSTVKGFAFTAVSVQHTLCDNSQLPTLLISLCLAPLFFQPLQVVCPFGVRAFVLDSLFVSFWFDLPLSWAFFPWHQYRRRVIQKKKSIYFKNFFWLIFTIYKTARARLNPYYITN